MNPRGNKQKKADKSLKGERQRGIWQWMWRIQENTGRFVFSFLLNLLNLLFVTFLQSRTEGYASLMESDSSLTCWIESKLSVPSPSLVLDSYSIEHNNTTEEYDARRLILRKR